jgi:four helix bundle protein
MADKVLLEKSKKFAVRVINLYKHLTFKKSEFILAKQILRSGTSIGANLVEAYAASSKRDFLNKTYIAFKECCETLYWLDLLKETEFITSPQFDSLDKECGELKRMLSATTKTTKSRISS